MACIHGLSPHDCQDPRCSTVATATAESTSTSEYSSSEGHESSSDEVDVIVDDMRTANLARSRPNNNNSNALKKGTYVRCAEIF